MTNTTKNTNKAANTINILSIDYPMKKSKFTVNASPIHISDNMTGKMAGIPSISTSCIENPICLKRMQDGDSICSHCFAETTLRRYTAAGAAMARNTILLSSKVLPLDLLPIFANVQMVRIESFGDVQNATQVINYCGICKVNPDVTFAAWTKNASIWKKALDVVGKPANLILIESSPKMNKIIKPSNEYIDKTFTVFTKDYKKVVADPDFINCGARCCATCKTCYKKDTCKELHELLK